MKSQRILSKNIETSNDCFETQLNNNDIIIGCTGTGKTRGYVIPNLIRTLEEKDTSCVVVDTKGYLYGLFGKAFEKAEYNVYCIDFSNMSNSPHTYNPLINIVDNENNEINEEEIGRLTSFFKTSKPARDSNSEFWDELPVTFLEKMIQYLLKVEGKKDSDAVLNGNVTLYDAFKYTSMLVGKENYSEIKTFAEKIGKEEAGEDFTDDEWKLFFKTNLIPLDKASELHMIDLFKDNRLELNKLLVLHNTKAGENIAEVYFKRYMKDSPTKWYDLDDFKQMANEGLAIAAERFDPSKGNKFITFATWWMLNRVRKPNQEKGAMVNHSSLSSPLNSNDADSVNTLEDVLSPNSLSPDWNSVSNSMGVLDPISSIEYKSTVESMEIFSTMRDTQLNSIDNIDKNKVENMIEYLMSIVEQNENSYDNKQLYLYIFKKVFNKYQTICKDNRAFRKYICPVTVFLKPISYFSLIRIQCDKDKCILCMECVKNCPKNAL